MVIPDTAKLNILQRDQKGQSKHKTFVGERILAGSATSIWDPMNKLKLKTHSTWMAKQKARAARFLVIQQSRPELVPKLPYTIGDYEMSVVPRSVFANNGSLLIPTDKSIVVPPEDEIVQTFTHMGNDSHAAEAALKSPLQDYGNIPEMYRPIE